MAVLMRHGATGADRLKIAQGWSPGGLIGLGFREVRAAGAKLLRDGPLIEEIVASDLTRSEQSARVLARILRVPVILTPLLRSWNIGALSGTKESQLEPLLREYSLRRPLDPVPEGESSAEFRGRVVNFFRREMQQIVARWKAGARGVRLFLGHSNVLETIIAWLKGGCSGRLDPRTIAEGLHLEHAGMVGVYPSAGCWDVR